MNEKIINFLDKDISRRNFLGILFGGCISFSLRDFFYLYNYKNPRLLRPPGAVKEDKFLALCIRCQACVKVCPTKTLQPTTFEAGIFGIYTPRLEPKIAGCEMTMACAKVCPTGALKEIKKEDMKIGLANIDKETCINWKEGKLCLICVEHCPTLALGVDKKKRPILIPEKCNGCAICENVCPVKEPSIIVLNIGEKRY